MAAGGMRAWAAWMVAAALVISAAAAASDADIFGTVLRSCTMACDQQLKLPADVCEHSICRFVDHVRADHGAYLRWIYDRHRESPDIVTYAMNDAVEYIHRANTDDPHTLERYFATRLLHWEQQIQQQKERLLHGAHDEL